ncbi:hypothetical protein [Demequina sp.]|uniref:hypothetical protein n=1 Tax=Demequina sp. TaxID=2050685 RepID=UPI003D0BD8D4
MKTPTRILVTAGTAVVLFATSFLVANAMTPDALPVDEPIAIPASTTEQASVLRPVAVGEAALSAAAEDLSPATGTAPVTVITTESGGDLPEFQLSPAILEAAASLDSSAGLPLTEPSDEATVPTPAPTASGMPASDPCAVDAGDTAETCPEGVTATLLSLEHDETLRVWAVADPVTGADQGSSIWCPATDPGENRLRLGAMTTSEATVTVTYWPTDDPSNVQSAVLEPERSFATGEVVHCGATGELVAGDYAGSAIAASMSSISSAWPFTFDSRGRPEQPAMTVVPLGSNWLWVGVGHTPTESVIIKGFALADGGAASCADARSETVPALREDVRTHTSLVSATALRAANINDAFTRVTSALLYVPGGTQAGVCGMTFAGGDPSWDADVPERTQFASAAAPDSWVAAVTVRELTTYRPGFVNIRATGQSGSYCGPSSYITVRGEVSDTPTVTPVDTTLCRLGGQNIAIEIGTWWRSDAGTSEDADSTTRLLLGGLSCTGACPQPEPRTYTAFLPGLGQDQCPDSVADDCDLRRRTAGARATIDVTWEPGGGSGRAAWTVSGVAAQDRDAVVPDAPQFDELARLTGTLSADGFTAQLATTLGFDRQVTFTAEAVGPCYAGTATSAAVSGTARASGNGVWSAPVTFRNLCPGTHYDVIVRATADGSTTVAAPPGAGGVAADVMWWDGAVTTPQAMIAVKTYVRIERSGYEDAAFMVRDSEITVAGEALYPSFGYWQRDRCFGPGVTSRDSEAGLGEVPLAREYEIASAINVFSDLIYYPTSPTCEWRAAERWVVPANVTVTLDNLLRGTTYSGFLVRRDFPDPASGDNQIFRYEVTVKGQRVTG